MLLNKFGLKLIFNRTVFGAVKIASATSVKPVFRVNFFSSNVKEALNPSEKPVESVKIEPALKIVTKRNEVSCEDLIQSISVPDQTLTLIDVRDKADIEKYGLIPSAIHIPLNKIKSSFQLSNQDFKAAFGRDKPDFQSDSIIFYGLKELKSTSACEIAYSLGYKKARSFPGGFKEWTERGLEIMHIESAVNEKCE